MQVTTNQSCIADLYHAPLGTLMPRQPAPSAHDRHLEEGSAPRVRLLPLASSASLALGPCWQPRQRLQHCQRPRHPPIHQQRGLRGLGEPACACSRDASSPSKMLDQGLRMCQHCAFVKGRAQGRTLEGDVEVDMGSSSPKLQHLC